MLNQRDFYFVRHGETDWNLEHRAQGQTDIPLNSKGRMQASTIPEKIRDVGIKLVCTSPLQRAMETANIVAENLGVPVQVIDELKEACWGGFEGTVKGKWYTDWMGGHTEKGAEAYGQFIDRATRGLNLALANDGPVLIVAHGEVYWAVEHATKIQNGGDAANCGVMYHEPPCSNHPSWRIKRL